MVEKNKSTEKKNRIRSSEFSGQPVDVTTNISWVLVIAVTVLVSGFLYWGFFGTVDVQLKARGILVSSGGFSKIYSTGEGRVYDISVKQGDHVRKGDIIARIDRPDIVNEILLLEQKASDMAEGTEKRELEKQLEALKERLRQESYVVSSESGNAVEVLVQKGQFIEKGQELVKVERTGETVKDLVAVLYYPVDEGKRIKSGMACRLVPSTINKEQYGFLLGTVVSVSEYPLTEKAIADFTGSTEFGELFAQRVVLEVLVDLIPSEKTASGYTWSSPDGPPVEIESGTVCDGLTIVDSVSPASLIL